MSLTAAAWIAIAGTLLLLSLRRPVFAAAFYMQTFFAAPHLWWWGGGIPRLRYAVIAGVALLVAVAIRHAQSAEAPQGMHRLARRGAILIALNATFVHFVIAAYPDISLNNYIEMLKYVALFFLLCACVRTRADFRVLVIAMVLGAAYIGYEVTINERGDFRGSRLEGVGAPAADTSNSLASVMLVVLPLAGILFIEGSKKEKLAAVLGGPLILNLLLLCNSRGAFLGLIGAGGAVLALSRGPTRAKAVKSLALGGLALFLLLGDPEILRRFSTTFVGSEDRDASAAGRITFWRAGLLMLQDHPLGAGGGGFKFIYGAIYLPQVGAADEAERSLHNAYLTEATEWGIQGLLFRFLFVGGALMYAYRTSVRCRKEGRANDALTGICLIAALAGFLIAALFGSFFTNEWSFWIIALLVKYGQLYELPVAEEAKATTAITAWVPPSRVALEA